MPALAPLCRDFLPADLAPLRAAHGVGRTVLVQAAPSEAETDFLLGLADQDDSIAAVVGWVDLGRTASAQALQRRAAHPRFKGVRPMLQDLPDRDWIAHAPQPAVVATLVRLGLCFDALVKPANLAGLLRFVDRWPDLRVVVDHAAKPALALGWAADWAPAWRTGMAELARRPNVWCKFSGLLTEAGADAARQPLTTLRPVWDVLFDGFGAQRLMWGSDWPVLNLVAGYGDWLSACASLAAALSPEQQAGFWSGNAERFYGLAGAGAP